MRRLLCTMSLLILGVSACGVADEGGADLADADEVPFGLLDAQHDPVTGPDPGRGSVVELYLYSEEEARLVPVRQRIEQSTLEDVLSALLDGAGENQGLRSPIGGTEVVLGAETEGGVAVIDLSEEFTEISGSDQLVAIAQLVYTSTGRPGVGQVSFTLEGRPTQIPRGDGSIISGSVTRGDYADLAPA